MKRNDFLKHLAGLAGFGWLGGAGFMKSSTRGYTLYEGWIAGYMYYNGPDVEKSLKAGLPLRLLREPDNKHDHRAIEIYAGSAKLGYIPKVDNRVLATLLDQGASLEADIAAIRPDNHPLRDWEPVKVRVWMGSPG